MNRTDELEELMALTPPPALEDTLQRARRRRAGRRGKILGIPAASLAGIAAAFVLLVNTSIPFALACGQVPLLRGLTAAAAQDPSLKAALESSYYQILDQEYTENGITLKLYCAVADEHRVNVFLTVSEGHGWLYRVFPGDGSQLGYSATLDDLDARPGELQYFTVDFAGGTTPQELTFLYQVTPDDQPDGEVLAQFRVSLSLERPFLESGRTVEVGKTFALDGQTITLDRLILNPTHAQLDFSDHQGNTAWLTGLDFYLEDERGTRYDGILNGISSFHEAGEDTPFTGHYRLESAYFGSGEHLKLHITGARWLDQGQDVMTLDIPAHRAENLPGYVLDWSAVREGGGWRLEFTLEKTGGSIPFFSTEGYDSSGCGFWTDQEDENLEHIYVLLENCGDQLLTLPLWYSRGTPCDTVLELF